ncbi:MAG: thioredoxin [Cyclobacteriaceae bacterium]|nr:MAG: thioredoxin [Cyclobacteriaceae bacterium]
MVGESSPYLLQHAHNPVNWYPWGDAALEKAEKEQKLIVISVGYAACHWCHVMEEESFEDSLVAKIMNDNFVSIKVDREERPDIDKIYMDAAYLMTGRGGWPLNVIALPDGKPIFAGTYFPKSDWVKILEHVGNEYSKDPDRLREMAEKVTEGINTIETVELNTNKVAITKEALESLHADFISEVDFVKGGRRGEQKFPTPSTWKYLMHHYYFNKDDQSLNALNTTLTAMANGGIYDHLGGGFSRYTTDDAWRVPHFEKMLYDNSQLVSLYSKAYQLTQDPLYKKVVMETTAFIKREMTSPEGGFYSSYDADSEGEEGKFYVWTDQEIRDLLGDQAEIIVDYFGVEKEGNWEDGKNILMPVGNLEEVREKHGLGEAELKEIVNQARTKMFQSRSKRVAPGLDDKVLTAWNALMITGYLDAYRVFKEDEFLQMALTNANFLVENAMSTDGRLNRNYKDGKSSINGFLDDYSFLIQAFIGLYEATFEEEWLRKAEKMTDYVLEHFFNDQNGMFYYTSNNDTELITRKMELSDGDIPGSNGIMAQNLYYLGTYLYQEDHIEIARQMVHNILPTMEQQPIFYSNWAMLLLQLDQPLYEVAIVGDQWMDRRNEFDAFYLPNVIYLGGPSEGGLELLANKLVENQTTIYVCENKSCRLPVKETQKALELMDQELLKGIVEY